MTTPSISRRGTSARASKIVTHGVTVSAPAPRWGSLTVFFHDPSGNRIEFWSPAD